MSNLDTAKQHQECCEAINTYLFQNIWNEPFSEYRVNIQPSLVKRGSSVNTFSYMGRNVPLPEHGVPYFVWAIAARDSNLGIKLPTATWVDTAKVANDYRTLVNMYTLNGKMFAKCATHLFYTASRNIIFIAVEKTNVLGCTTFDKLKEVYLTLYYDSDLANSIEVLSFRVPGVPSKRKYQGLIDDFMSRVTNNDQLTIYRNGIEITDPDNLPEPEIGVYLDFVNDRNIAFSWDVDLSRTRQLPTFYSEKDKKYKQLIHIPRALNPDNRIITHNTCDIWVRRKMMNSKEVDGRYFHRLAEGGVTQVTHNDFAICVDVLDNYRDHLGVQNITLHLVARIHDKDNVLIRDANYIDLLYSHHHTDEDIVKFLIGKHEKLKQYPLTWWEAPHLESSKYVEMMFDTPNHITEKDMANFTQALGYYSTCNLLCDRINTSTLGVDFRGRRTYQVPVILHNTNILPVLYLNQHALTSQQYDYYVNYREGTLTVELKNVMYYPKDTLTIVLYAAEKPQVHKLVVDDRHLYIDVDMHSFHIYRQYDDPITYKNVNTSSHYGYQEVTNIINTYTTRQLDNGKTRIVFNTKYIGETFYVVTGKTAWHFDVNLTSYIEAGKTLAIPLELPVNDSDQESIPALPFTDANVYLNGDYLVKGLDYQIVDVYDDDQRVTTRSLVVQSMDHFLDGKPNILDIVLTTVSEEERSTGYALNDQLRDASLINLYFENISTLHVAGKLETDATYHGTYMQVPEGKYQNGDIFEIETCIPQAVKEFIDAYASSTEDQQKLKCMNSYFYDTTVVDAKEAVLPGKHRVYSVFLNAIIHDYMKNGLKIILDPDSGRFKEQFKSYLYLQKLDLVYQGTINQQFTDFYPSYVYMAGTPAMRVVVDRLMREFLPANLIPAKEVLYTSED